jgi:hypothetical protein
MEKKLQEKIKKSHPPQKINIVKSRLNPCHGSERVARKSIII